MNGHFLGAWRVLVPDLEGRHGPLPPVLLALTVVTGVVDAFSYLLLGHVFVANMTGNVVFLAFSFAGSSDFSAWASGAALLAFAAGALLGGRVAHTRRAHRGKLVFEATVVEAMVVAAAYVVAVVHGQPFGGTSRYLLIVLLGLAMGVQNAAARALAVPDLTTTVLTLTITGIAADSRYAGGPDSKVGRRLVSATAMFLGALIGALVALRGSGPVVLLIAAGLLVLAAAAAAVMRRSHRDWVHPLG